MRRNEKYPNGYLPKIEFWEAKYLRALEEGIGFYRRGNTKKGEESYLLAKEAERKVAYFMERELELLRISDEELESLGVY